MSAMTDEKKPEDGGEAEESFEDALASPTSETQDEGDNHAAEGLHFNMVDLDSMKDSVFFLFEDRNQRMSRFWILIILASIIATMGVAGDSAATVIGAMIVAPLMAPILGTMLSIVLTDGPNFWCSLALVMGGAGTAILIGYALGLCLYQDQILAENNSQISSRVEPKLTDLIAALATGAVGSIALVRKDIAGTLPGVAIAISLVPPLSVVGLTLSTGDGEDASGAFLLFATNFASILVMGVIVMYIYRVEKQATRARAHLRRTAILVLFLLLGFIAIPLAFTSMRLAKIREVEKCVSDAIDEWGEPRGWSTKVVVARAKGDKFEASVTITGPPPFPDAEDISEGSDDCNVDEISASFFPEKKIEL